jgi:hypothetical protein
MHETIDSVEGLNLRLRTRDGRILLFVVQSDRPIPEEFVCEDLVNVVNYPVHPTIEAMELEDGRYYGGYYDITHVKTGSVLRSIYKHGGGSNKI